MTKIIVIGASNIDIIAKSYNKLIPNDSNIGSIELHYGGVARNIAENIKLLNEKIYFLSIFSNDHLGNILYNKCKNDGFNLTYSKIINTHKTSTYLALMDQNNDMNVAINDMSIINELKIKDINKALINFKENDYVIIDNNISKETIKYILTNKHYKVAIDPISINKIYKIKDLLPYIDIFKPNLYQAKALTNLNKPIDIAKQLISTGIKELCITLNKDGVLYYNSNNNTYHRQYINNDINIINTTGSGDSFLATYITYRKNNYPIDQSISYALIASTLTIQTNTIVNTNINTKLLDKLIKQYNIIKEDIC